MSSVGKEANAFQGGSVNRPEQLKGAYPGITRLDQLFRVNHLYIKKPLECTFLSHIVKYTLVAARRLLTDADTGRLLSCVCRQPLWRPKHLFESKQTAVKGTFDHRRHKSKVACCQTREPSSSQYLFAAELLWSFPEMGTERERKSPAGRTSYTTHVTNDSCMVGSLMPSLSPFLLLSNACLSPWVHDEKPSILSQSTAKTTDHKPSNSLSVN